MDLNSLDCLHCVMLAFFQNEATAGDGSADMAAFVRKIGQALVDLRGLMPEERRRPFTEMALLTLAQIMGAKAVAMSNQQLEIAVAAIEPASRKH